MLRILEQKNLTSYQERINQLPGDVELHLSEVLDDQNHVAGWILYAYQPDKVLIFDLDDGQDWDYCDGLIRSVLFKAELKGIEQAEFRIQNADIRNRIEKLGFVKSNQNILGNIGEVMESCKKCKENSANT